MHALAPSADWRYPTAHSAHADATLLPDAATNRPAEHLSHWLCPSDFCVVPGPHLVHTDAWALEYRPAWHAVHADWPASPCWRPAVHSRHVVVPVEDWYLPTPHFVHAVCSELAVNMPLAQGVHTDLPRSAWKLQWANAASDGARV